MHHDAPFATLWSALAKTQAQALQDELNARGLIIKRSQAIELRAQLAAQRSWNHYSAALQQGKGVVNPLLGLEERLQASLARLGLTLPPGEAQQVLAQMERAGLTVLHRALMTAQAHVALYPVTGTVLNLRTLDHQLAAVDEGEVMHDLERARPHFGELFEEPELLPLLATLCEQEGPGVLAALHTPDDVTWAYLQDERQAVLFALAQATLPEIVSERFGWSRARLRRTAPPSWPLSGSSPQATGGRFSWARLWLHGEGLEPRLAQLEARLPAGFPFGASLPTTLTPTEAHLAFWDALEGAALRARQSPPPSLNWPTTLDEGALKALHSSLAREVQAVLRGARTRFPEAAQADIRAAVAAGRPVVDLLAELDVLLEDEQWHARQRVWQQVHDLREVQVGDTLCVNGGQPFQVRAVAGVQGFTLSVMDHQGRSQAIEDRDRLERRIVAQG
ncbi:hypothetical protein K7W42_18425 [Deinococcus sp. HMF7604]|uniref:glyoxalase superfamily protein n=1 Tax=Deinococcus betulae TaxID=2873312 RepID=UPI001CC9A309|nr:glyoxalase superfamily protein [Deinococcus betulae]MBZ9752820.1 hypothetical protein [Deinococcus betulae]